VPENENVDADDHGDRRDDYNRGSALLSHGGSLWLRPAPRIGDGDVSDTYQGPPLFGVVDDRLLVEICDSGGAEFHAR
jgi:hypothetical protein